VKKVLIVDDVENNRILLRTLLESFAEENGFTNLQIDEAANGSEAVEQAKIESYELIFMDIMMPVMDGIEATGLIRKINPKVLIIAVSAIDDSERQKEIIKKGAEDYVAKPINIEIFLARLSLYDSLIKSRQTKHLSIASEPINLFTNQLYSRKLTFYTETAEQLAEFWEYYLLNQEKSSSNLSAAVRTLYTIGSFGIKLNAKTKIISEENEKNIYLTITNIETIEPKIIQLILLKNKDLSEFKQNESKLSIQVPLPTKNHLLEISEPLKTFTNEETNHPHEQINTPPFSEIYTQQELPLKIYNYMEEEDLEEIKDFIASLDSLMLVVGSGDIQSHEVDEIAQDLERISKIASLYNESYSISSALGALAEDIRNHHQEFLEKSNSLGVLCTAFSRDLSSWIRIIFSEGARSVDFMDDTIISNAQMIGSMLKMDESSEEVADLDDIFDF
jgi:CheY-like chemotaxis protein